MTLLTEYDMARQAHPHNFSARVDDAQRQKLYSIERTYGVGMNPSALASTLLRKAADCGVENIHLFMKEVTSTAERLKSR